MGAAGVAAAGGACREAPAVAWHALAADEVAARLGSDAEAGLSEAEAAARRARLGPNALPAAAPARWPRVLGRQLASPLVAILGVAAAVSAALGAGTDAGVILAILVLNALLGFAQEWRAERALAALRQMLAPATTLVRAGTARRIDARELVPGDLVRLAAGDRVPADLRLVEERELRADESALTGESSPVSKQVEPVAAGAPLAERRSCAFTGTTLTSGGGSGLVVATGLDTELGRIARLARAVGDERTPLQRRLASLGAQLGALALAVAAATALAGWLLGRAPIEMLLTGVALAVAVVPEGLPAVVTISLALGARAMARRQALVRRLQAAETLGSASVICTDKTGTLTQNAMTVRAVWLAAGELAVEGTGYAPEGGFLAGRARVAPESRPDLIALLETGVACSHAALSEERGTWRAVGEPTEAALLAAARKAGLAARPPAAVHELPFDSGRKRMTRVVEEGGARVAHVKGAPELVLARCAAIRDGAAERPLSEADRAAALAAWQRFAEQGLRTLALARRALPADAGIAPDALERDLVLLGVVGILDPPRPEVPAAVAEARAAGIRVVMLTGDALPTALSIARQIGLPAARGVTGAEFEALSDDAVAEAVAQGAVFARTTPEQKLRLVELLRARGEVVAMTGDGVNDAPALQRADIGVAMGVRGTDVARGAADMVLLDDDFASIVHAVEEGRRQVDNLQKFVRYLLSANLGEAAAIIANVLLGGPLILLPVQILWINLVTDGVTAVALALEPLEAGAMRRAPRPVRQPLVDRRGWLQVLAIGGWIAVAVLVLFHQALDAGDEVRARTLAFTGLVVLEKAAVLGFRSLSAPLSAVGWASNPWLLAAIASMLGLQAAAVHLPWLGALLHTTPLSASDWLLLLVLALPALVLSEAWKRAAWRRDGLGASAYRSA
jgi:Ca2+-transporting ATPase